MAGAGLTPDRLRQMARLEVALADPPVIWPGLPYAEQKRRAAQLQEIEAFGLAKLWRVLAEDHDRITQRVVIARGIEWRGELQDRTFIRRTAKLQIAKQIPVLILDADQAQLIRWTASIRMATTSRKIADGRPSVSRQTTVETTRLR
jgi:hypothetical protein